MTPRKSTKTPKKKPTHSRRYGIGEWYGFDFTSLSKAEMRDFARQQLEKGKSEVACPFRAFPPQRRHCTKKGGVCSLRLYERENEAGVVSAAKGTEGRIAVTCPDRFDEAGLIYEWVGEIVLNNKHPRVLSQIGFLEGASEGKEGDDVGRIDNILVSECGNGFQWCALEKQAVYFQGAQWERNGRLSGNMMAKSCLFRRHFVAQTIEAAAPKG